MTERTIGALCWSRHTKWPALLGAGVLAEELGYDTLWTWGRDYPTEDVRARVRRQAHDSMMAAGRLGHDVWSV